MKKIDHENTFPYLTRRFCHPVKAVSNWSVFPKTQETERTTTLCLCESLGWCIYWLFRSQGVRGVDTKSFSRILSDYLEITWWILFWQIWWLPNVFFFFVRIGGWQLTYFLHVSPRKLGKMKTFLTTIFSSNGLKSPTMFLFVWFLLRGVRMCGVESGIERMQVWDGRICRSECIDLDQIVQGQWCDSLEEAEVSAARCFVEDHEVAATASTLPAPKRVVKLRQKRCHKWM